MAQRKNQITLSDWLRSSTLRLARVHFLFVGLLCVQIVLYDASKLITPQQVMQRMIVTALLLVAVTIIWLLAHNRANATNYFKHLISALIIADIFVASTIVYLTRGMASRGVLLYLVPIIVSAVLLSRTAIFATAIVCIAAYTVAAISYFVLNFNEGYKVELYGEVSFYAATFLIAAALLSVFIRFKEE